MGVSDQLGKLSKMMEIPDEDGWELVVPVKGQRSKVPRHPAVHKHEQDPTQQQVVGEKEAAYTMVLGGDYEAKQRQCDQGDLSAREAHRIRPAHLSEAAA
jgi:hypothetical protein